MHVRRDRPLWRVEPFIDAAQVGVLALADGDHPVGGRTGGQMPCQMRILTGEVLVDEKDVPTCAYRLLWAMLFKDYLRLRTSV